jgi:hypothetical protein
VGLANLGSESETCVRSRVLLVGVSISFEKNFYRPPFTPPFSGSPYRSFANMSSPRKGTAVPSNGDEYFSRVYTGLHRNVRPTGTVFSVTISPVQPSPPLQHHIGHCSAIPHAVKAHGDGTSPRPPLCLVGPPLNGTLETAHGQQPDEHPLCHHTRSRPCTGTVLATTSQQEQDSPGRSSAPWNCTSYLHT